MKKQFVRCFLSLFASALMAQAAHAERSATFMLFTPRYYRGTEMVASSPSFVLGQRGAITSTETFPSSATYAISADKMPAGYYVSKWLLSTSWGAGLSGTRIKEQTGGTNFSVTFDYAWAAQYGTALDLTVYLEPLSYVLSYQANGGGWTAGQPQGGTHQYSDTVYAPASGRVERKNYTFVAWQDNAGNAVGAGEAFDGSAFGVKENGQSVILYAQWTPKRYAVTLNANGGFVDSELTGYTYGVGATLPVATKKKCTFEGWYDNPLLASNVVTRISASDSGDKEYWAKFVPVDAVVHYNGNGATSGTMPDSSFVYNVPKALSENAFARAYTVTYNANGGSFATNVATVATATYTFKCWNDKANGSGDYTYNDLQLVTNPCGSDGDPVTLYAQWDDEPVTVTLPEVTPPEGKAFAGWFTAQSGGIRVGGANDTYEPSRAITLYAQWKTATEKITYHVRFSPGADVTNSAAMATVKKTGTVGGAPVSLPPGIGVEIPYENLASTTCTGWIWNGVTNSLNSSFTLKDAIDGETIAMRAAWTNDQGELSEAVGLKNAILKSTNNTWSVQSEKGRIADSDCIGTYAAKTTFVSMKVKGAGMVKFYWKSSKGSGVGPDAMVSVDGDSVALKLTTTDWEVKSIPVAGEGIHEITWSTVAGAYANYYMDDVEWIPSSSPKFLISTSSYPEAAGSTFGGGTYDAGKRVTLSAIANANYVFSHWSDGSTNNPHTVTVQCDENIEAVFSGNGTPEYYYVLFNGNGADNLAAMDGQRVPRGTATALTANKFSHTGYTFAGWATTRKGPVAYADRASVKDLAAKDGAVTLYAVWDEVPAPEPEKTKVTVTITGNTKTVEYTGAKQTVSGYAFSANVAAYTQSYCDFTGKAEASGTEAGTYRMGLSAADFTNRNDDYDVTFAVADGALVIIRNDPKPVPSHYTSTVGESVAVDLAGAYPDDEIKRVSGLPSGLTYYPATGYVTGKPTKAGTKTVTIYFADGERTTVTWTVAAGANHGVKIDFGEAATGETSAKVGVGTAVAWTLSAAESGAKVTVSKLPSGLKYNKKTGLITGTPTKAGAFTMTVKTVVNGTTVTQTFAITVEPLPAMMVGTYYGAAKVEDGSVGQFQLKLTAAGKVTGSFYAAGKKISFKGTELGRYGDGYAATVTYKYNRETQTDTLLLAKAGEAEGVDLWVAKVGSSDVLDGIEAQRDVIKEAYGRVKAATYAVEDETLGEGEYLNAKVSSSGAVKVSGKLADESGKLRMVSCSTRLVIADEGLGCWITIYKKVSKQNPITYARFWVVPED